MKLLRFKNEDGSIDVSYKTDLITESQSNFTVLSIEGLDDTEVAFGLQFKSLPTNKATFIKFATDNELQLISLDLGHSTAEAIELVAIPVPPDPEP